MLEASPLLRYDEQLGADLVGYERHLPLTQDRDQWVLHRADPRQRHQEHRGLDVVGSCQDTTVPPLDPPSREGGSRCLSRVPELGSGQRPAVVVGYDKGPWSYLSRSDDEGPELRWQRRPRCHAAEGPSSIAGEPQLGRDGPRGGGRPRARGVARRETRSWSDALVSIAVAEEGATERISGSFPKMRSMLSLK